MAVRMVMSMVLMLMLMRLVKVRCGKLLMAHGWRVIRTGPMMPDSAGGFTGDSDITITVPLFSAVVDSWKIGPPAGAYFALSFVVRSGEIGSQLPPKFEL